MQELTEGYIIWISTDRGELMMAPVSSAEFAIDFNGERMEERLRFTAESWQAANEFFNRWARAEGLL